MSFLFSPPAVLDVPTTVPYRHPGNALMRHYRPGPRGRTVLRIAGAYSTHDEPSAALVATASEVYIGGHVYEVSDAVATALQAAGYSVSTFPIATEDGAVLLTEAGDTLVREGAA